MFFALKKIISVLFQPLPMVWILLIGSLWFFRKMHRKVLYFLLFLSILFSGAMFGWIPDRLLKPLERRYAPYEAGREVHPRWVVVLGQSFSAGEGISESGRINATMHARLAEALNVFRSSENMHLLVSLSGKASAQKKQAWWIGWCRNAGIPVERTSLITDAVDTRTELQSALERVGTDPFVLVTSASHLPRSMLIARSLSGNPIAAPCDYQVLGGPLTYNSFLPSIRNADKLGRALHEYIGMAWFEIFSNIPPRKPDNK